MSGIFYCDPIWVLTVRIPVVMTPKNQNSSNFPIATNLSTEQLQEKRLQEKKYNDEDNPVGALDDATKPVPVSNFPPASGDDI